MGGGGRSSSSPPSSSSQSNSRTLDRQWVPLQDHPLFRSTASSAAAAACSGDCNLAAWDAASSRLYLWDPNHRYIHRLSLRFSGDSEGDDERASSPSSSPSILAASPSEVLTSDVPIESDIRRIFTNADGSSLVLLGPDGVSVMHLYDRASSSSTSGNTITYRTSDVGSQIFSAHNNGLQILQVSWHPYSSSHLGILSSDSVLRLFDLSSDLEHPEQEFYLQPLEVGQNTASICPVAFSFGGLHLWDRFSVFVLFSDGSTYILCPVVPFGSVCGWTFLEELYEDAKEFGLKSSNASVISNFNLALDWLESTFPELANQSLEKGNRLVLRAHPYAPLDASLTLQGPLSKVSCSDENDDSRFWGAGSDGKAVSFLYSCIGKDSVLVIGWSSGQLQIDALADEVQPLWSIGNPPRIRVDSCGHIKGVAMICEPDLPELSGNISQSSLNISYTADSVCLGPPLLRLATVDLALPTSALDRSSLALFSDPLMAERFYCLHAAGIDLVSLHFLPFSNPLNDADKSEKEPSVIPILISAHGESCSTPAFCGFVAISDACGHSQIVGITRSYECIVLESEAWTEAAPLHYGMDSQPAGSSDVDIPEVISKELLSGPKAIVVPSSTALKSLSADSIEGRSVLHQYIKLFHENYVEYAHKVFVELEHHGEYLRTNIDNQNIRLHEAKQSLLNVEEKQRDIEDRISRAFKVYDLLEQRLKNFRMLPGANKKPLSRAEREFKTQLETFADVDVAALHSSIEALNARVRRCFPPNAVSTLNVKGQLPARRKTQVSDSQMQRIRASMEMLSVINSENTKKISLIEHELTREGE